MELNLSSAWYSKHITDEGDLDITAISPELYKLIKDKKMSKLPYQDEFEKTMAGTPPYKLLLKGNNRYSYDSIQAKYKQFIADKQKQKQKTTSKHKEDKQNKADKVAEEPKIDIENV